jgi:hypothetical protein
VPTILLSDLRARTLARLDGNSILYTTPEVDAVINECIRVTALFTNFYRTTVQLPGWTVANQLVYDTPSPILKITSVMYEGRQLNYASLRELARTRRNWATDTTAAKGQPDYWAPIGLTKFVISPKDSVGGNDLSLTGIGEPPLLVNATDVFQMENEFIELVPEYCSHRLQLKEGGKIFSDASLSLNTFYDCMKERKAYEFYKFGKVRRLGDKGDKPQ